MFNIIHYVTILQNGVLVLCVITDDTKLRSVSGVISDSKTIIRSIVKSVNLFKLEMGAQTERKAGRHTHTHTTYTPHTHTHAHPHTNTLHTHTPHIHTHAHKRTHTTHTHTHTHTYNSELIKILLAWYSVILVGRMIVICRWLSQLFIPFHRTSNFLSLTADILTSSCPDNGQCPSKKRHDSSSVREDSPDLHSQQHHTAEPHIAQSYNIQALLNIVQLAYQLVCAARNLMFCFSDDLMFIWNCNKTACYKQRKRNTWKLFIVN